MQKFLLFIRRHAAAITLISVLGSGLTAAYVVSLPPEYETTAVILLDPGQTDVAGSEMNSSGFLGDTSAVESEVELVRSQAVALRVAPAVVAAEEELRARGANISLIYSKLNTGDQMTLSRQLSSKLDVERVRQTYLIGVIYSAPDPVFSAFVANAFAQGYLDDQLAAKIASMEEADRLLDSRVADLTQRVRDAESAVENYRLETQRIVDLQPRTAAEVQLRDLERKATAARTYLESFLAQSTQVSEQKNLQLPQSRIVQTAVPPPAPTGPERALFMAAGAIVSVGLGIAFAAMREAVDRSIRAGARLPAAIGARRIASIPRLTARWKGPARKRPSFLSRKRRQEVKSTEYLLAATAHLLHSPFSVFSESIRALHVAVQGPNSEDGPKLILVTSALYREGVSTIASALAVSASQVGRNALLVDLNHRRPTLTQAFSPDSGPGVLDLLCGHSAPNDVIRHLPDRRLSFIPASRSFPLFQFAFGRSARDVFAQLRDMYSLIIIDAPPLLPVADSRPLIGLVDGVLLVAKWGVTPMDALLAVVDHSPGLSEQLVGVALNQVNIRRAMLYEGYGCGIVPTRPAGEFYQRVASSQAAAASSVR